MTVSSIPQPQRPDAKRRPFPLPFMIPALLLVVIAAALICSNLITRAQTLARAEKVLRDSAEEQAATLESILDGQYQTLEALAASIGVQDKVSSGSVVTALSAVAKASNFLHLFYTLPDGTSLRDDGAALDVSGRAYFQQALTGVRSIERVTASAGDGTLRLVLAVPILRDGRVVGVVQGSYNEQILRERIIPEAYGGEAYSTVCNVDGDYIIGTDNPNFQLPERNVFDTLSGAAFDRGNSLEQFHSAVESGESGVFFYEMDGLSRFAVYIPLHIVSAVGKGWFMLNVVPGSMIDQEVAADTSVNALLFLAVMLCTLALLLFILFRERRAAALISAERDQLRISGEEFRIAASLGGRGIAHYDIATRTYYSDCGAIFSEQLGSVVENAPQAFIDAGLVAPSSVEETVRYFDRIRSGERNAGVVVSLRAPDGAFRWFQSDATVVFDAQGQPLRAILVFSDVTEQREKEAVYRKWQQSLQAKPQDAYTLFRCNLSKDASFDSVEGSLLQIHFSGENTTFDSRTLEYAEQYVHPDDLAAYVAFLDADTLLAGYYRGKRSAVMEYRERGEANAYRYLRLSYEMVEYPNSSDVAIYLLYEDIDEEKRTSLLAAERAESDPLTGVLHRAAFAEKFERLIKQTAPHAQHALLMIDIDGFKLLNDCFGHAAGDQALLDIASSLRAVLRPEDLLGRVGGDEFLICLPDIPYDAVIEKKAAQICTIVRKAFSLEVQISASIGVAVYPRDGDDFDTLYRNADAALYEVKGSGKNNFAFYDRDLPDSRYLAPLAEGGEPASRPDTEIKRRILIVDDSEINRAVLSKIFADEFLVDTAGDGRTALIRLRHYGTGVSVVLLDLVMPSMDGFAVLEKMRGSAELRSIPVVVVSGASDRETILKTIEYGASDFVTKPVDPDLVRLRVYSAIRKAENERQRAQNSYLLLQSGEEVKYRTVLESTGTVVIEYNWLNGQFVYDSSISKHIAGRFDDRRLWSVLLSDMVAGSMDVKAMQDLVHDVATDRTRMTASLTVRLRIPTQEREKHWFIMRVFKQTDEFQLTDRMILTFNDINEEMLADEKLRFQAERDDLTGLYNRRTFLHMAEEDVHSKPAGSFVMFVGDVDRFKLVNDRLGHAEGDRLLQFVARKLSDGAERLHGLCGRLGNDVFAALLPYTATVGQNAERFTRTLFSDYPLDLKLTCSIGQYRVGEPGLPADSMLDRASLAKQSIKGNYESRLAAYDETMRQRLLTELAIADGMEEALASGQFDIYLQPQYNHATGEITGAEALVRWIHPEKGVISPGDFIPVFERNGFISKLDEYVWDRTAALLRGWLDGGHPAVPVSVNVSRLDTNDPLLCEKLHSIVARHNIPIELFRLEITESLFVEDAGRLIDVVDRLHAIGFLIEMDDFGSGYSSLNILKDVPVDVLKLDMRFFSGGGDTARGGTILSAVMRMARWLRMPVVAEGVETTTQADFLASIGCPIIQGYLYSKPLPVPAFETLLLDSRLAAADPAVSGGIGNPALWDPQSAECRAFNDRAEAAVIYEYQGDTFEAIRANRRFLDLLRFERDIPLPTRGLIAMHPDDIPRFRAAAERAAESGEPVQVVARRIFPDGSAPLTFRCTLSVLSKNFDSAMILCIAEPDGA